MLQSCWLANLDAVNKCHSCILSSDVFSGISVLKRYHLFSIYTNVNISITALYRGSPASCTVTVTAVNLSGVFSVMALSSECSFATLIMSCLPEFLAGFLFLMCLKKDLSLVSATCSSDFLFCLPCCALTFNLPEFMIY